MTDSVSLPHRGIDYSCKKFYCTDQALNVHYEGPQIYDLDGYPTAGLNVQHTTAGLYYKTLQNPNLREMDRFRSKLVTFSLDK